MSKISRFAADFDPCMEWGLLQLQRNLPPLHGVLRLGLVDDACRSFFVFNDDQLRSTTINDI